jgi:predicted PurR-regulated permease PerM
MRTLHAETDETTPPPVADASPPVTWRSPPDARMVSGVILAAVATVFALHWAQKVFIPLLIGIIIASTLNPIVAWLERMKIPRVVGASLLMMALLVAGVLATLSLRNQVERILDQVPEAAGRLSAALRDMAAEPNTVQKVQAAAREIEQATTQATDGAPTPQKPPPRVVVEQPRFKLVDLLWTGSLGMFGIIGDTITLLLLIFFLLLSGDTFKRKLLRVTGHSLSKKKITVSILDDIDRSIQNYMLTLLMANLVLALLTWMAFRWIGLDNAGAWAFAAGVLHFIPYLGPVLTALATGMAGFMQFGSFTMALLVSGSSLALATFVGMVLVTWMSGRISKMNATVVFIALLFWGWLWGAWGLLLAIPIMGMVKVFSEHIEDLQPLAELLGE